MFVVIKRKTVVVAAMLLVAVVVVSSAVGVCLTGLTGVADDSLFTVVLDAGHGGVDGGVKGAESGVYEREINLLVVREVEQLLKDSNVRVVLTRENEKGLYDIVEEGFKKKDFAARKAVIENASADLVVSVHCNKFPDQSRRGAQCFFEPTSPESVRLAEELQSALNPLNERELNKTYSALKGDYYMLKCTTVPSAIVECGFLSNPDDDRLLNTPSYRTELARAISSAILSYRSACSTLIACIPTLSCLEVTQSVYAKNDVH